MFSQFCKLQMLDSRYKRLPVRNEFYLSHICKTNKNYLNLLNKNNYKNENENENKRYIKWFKTADKIMICISGGGTVAAAIKLINPMNFYSDGILEAAAYITSTYGILKSGYILYNKIICQKSKNVFNNEEDLFISFLSFGGSLFALISTVGFSYLQHSAAVGQHVNQIIRLSINISIFGTTIINGINLAISAMDTVKKYLKRKTISTPEIFKLTISAAFFIHSFLQMKTANFIIKDAQNAKLLEIRTKLVEKNYQKMNFDRKIMLNHNEANFNGKSEIDGNERVIKKLNLLLKKPNWKENFGKAVDPESSAAIHASQPTHLTTNNFDIILKENAVLKAQYSHKTRYDGNRINQKSTNTILAIPPHEFDFKLAKEAIKQNISKGPVFLPGEYYGYEIKLGPQGIFKSGKIILAENPQFYFNGERGTHYFSKGGKIQYPETLPENINEIYADLSHNNFKGIYFVNLFSTKDTVFYGGKNIDETLEID